MMLTSVLVLALTANLYVFLCYALSFLDGFCSTIYTLKKREFGTAQQSQCTTSEIMNNGHIYFVQILFVTGIAIGSQILNSEDQQKWFKVARYAVYILTFHAVPAACKLLQRLHSKQLVLPDLLKAAEASRSYIVIYLGSVVLLLFSEQKLYDQDFVFIFLGYLLVQYPEMAEGPAQAQAPASKPAINYGVGMACSFFEGYLVHVIPSDGAKFVGFEENMRALEDQEGVLFPVKKMFIVITKSLYSPPDLKEFNRGTDEPHLEAFNTLSDVKKSVAGVRDRIYRNTAYKIYRPTPPAPPTPPGEAPAPPTPPAPPVCLAAECATPLHTLYRVLNNRVLYDEIADISVEQVVADFTRTLRSILHKSPECRGKCELVFYDHEDQSQNLAQILLDRIAEIEPDFEQKIIARRDENRIMQNIEQLEF